jgi:hypothetical protein
VKFKAELQLMGKTATGFVVPDNVVEKLAAGKRPPVVATVKRYSYRTTIAPMGGQFLLGVSAEHRAAAGLKAGDTVTVDVVVDAAPREVEVPKYIADAFTQAGVRAAFDKLSYTHRKEHVRAIEEAKADATRQRRIDKAIAMLRAKSQP